MNVSQVVQQISNIDLDDSIVPMRKGTSKSWMGEYHWVSPPMPRSQEVHVKRNNDQDKVDWCEQQFGHSGHRWFANNNRFYFKNEGDMTMFVLRWS